MKGCIAAWLPSKDNGTWGMERDSSASQSTIREKTQVWQYDYKHPRPYKSLDRLTPSGFVQ